jgi:uncharacterized membrane protein YczE
VLPGSRLPRRIGQLALGLFLYGIALALMLRASIGVSPWDVLSQGLDVRTGIGFGWITVAVGALVLLLWIPLKQRPGIGTDANVLFVGPSAEVGLLVLPVQTHPFAQGLMFTGGLLLLAVATGLYIGARFGPGPRDGLMTGIHDRTGWPIWVGRSIVEITVLGIGWILGGTVGIGTVAFALLVGPLVNITMPIFAVPETRTPPAIPTGKEVPA